MEKIKDMINELPIDQFIDIMSKQRLIIGDLTKSMRKLAANLTDAQREYERSMDEIMKAFSQNTLL